MPTKNVNLTDHYSQFVEQLVASGQYKNASEVFEQAYAFWNNQTLLKNKSFLYLRSLALEGFDEIDRAVVLN